MLFLNLLIYTPAIQLNIFTGPLYIIYKIISCIKLAENLNKRFPDKKFIPVYWMASEDHDFEEIQSFYSRGKNYVWETETSGSVGNIDPKSLEKLIDLLPGVNDFFREAYLKSETLSEAVRKYMNSIFKEYGLLILDPDSEALKIIPKSMDLEKITLKEMLEHGNPVKALRALPLSIRRFFIQSYQSFIFNKTLSMSFENDEALFSPQDDDVCYDKNSDLGKFENDPLQRLAVPFVGYSYYKKTRFHYYIEKILSDEEITHKDFFSKEMQEISSEGGFRNSSIKCENYKINDNVVSFSLSRGSFATIVLREIIKPENPLASGF